MVLDDASPQAGAYPDTPGRAGPQEKESLGPNPAMASNFKLQVKSDFVVRPDYFTLVFGFLGRRNWERTVAYTMMERVENSWLLTGRALTQDELDAFTAYSTQTLYYRRMGVPIASFFGTAWIYNTTRKNLSLPSNASPTTVYTALRNFAKADKAGFRSTLASAAFKMLFITTTGAILSGFAALWTETRSVVTDPRLRGFVEDMRGQKPEEVRNRKVKAASERVRRMRGGEKDIEPYIIEELRHPGSHVERNDTDSYAYDNSPTSSSVDDGMVYATSDESSSASQQQSMTATPRRTWGSSTQAGPARTGSAGEPSGGTDYFLSGNDDDASPTAPEYRNTNPGSSTSGSAWDRLRRQTGSQPSRAPPTQESAPQWGQQQDSGSSSERDMYYANQEREQNQAQAEFNRMLEAERQISNDSSQSRRW